MKIIPLNDNTAANGEWVDCYGVKILIARADNPKFKSAFLRLTKPHQKAIDEDTLSEEMMEDITVNAMAEGVLLGWEPFQTEMDGEVTTVEYSVSNACTLLKEDSDLKDFVFRYSNNIKNYLLSEEDRIKEK